MVTRCAVKDAGRGAISSANRVDVDWLVGIERPVGWRRGNHWLKDWWLGNQRPKNLQLEIWYTDRIGGCAAARNPASNVGQAADWLVGIERPVGMRWGNHWLKDWGLGNQ